MSITEIIKVTYPDYETGPLPPEIIELIVEYLTEIKTGKIKLKGREIYYIRTYVDGKKHGIWREWNGQMKRTIYRDGEVFCLWDV